jgi:hypothetical protein
MRPQLRKTRSAPGKTVLKGESNNILPSWAIGVYVATLALMVAISLAVEANLSTTFFLLVLGVSPAIVIAVLAGGAPSPTPAEILYSVRARTDR